MYLRLKNKPDLVGFCELFEKSGKRILFERMMEDIDILDGAYGMERESYAMGGYLLYFPTEEDYTSSVVTLAELYHFDPCEYEFDDSIWKDNLAGVMWKRRHYQLSSDDALVMYYPETVKLSERR